MAIKNSSTDIRQVLWSDRENNNLWAPAVDNFAGSQKLQGTGPLLGLYKVLNQILILSTTDAFVARYLGAPFVYGFERVGTQCAPIHKKAVATLGRFAIWLGRRNFWLYDGTLKPLPCDVMDHIAETISLSAASKIHCQTVSRFSEIWWFYQSKTSAEVDSYAVSNYRDNFWYTGKLARTAGVDAGGYDDPMMVDPNGLVWDHEKAAVQVVGTAFCSTGPLELQNGQRNMAVRYVLMDTELPDTVTLTLLTKQTPTSPLVTHGPYAYNNPISTTGALGREVRMRLDGQVADWEVGTMRFDVQQVGGGFR
jgi:hypothetical protein